MASENGAGWEDLTGSDIQGWWAPEYGPIQGRFIEAKIFIDDDHRRRINYVLETTAEAVAKGVGSDTDAEPEKFPKGSIIAVGHRAKLEPLRERAEVMTGFEVRIVPEEKIRLKKGRTMWKMKLAVKGGTKRAMKLALIAGPTAAEADIPEVEEELPF